MAIAMIFSSVAASATISSFSTSKDTKITLLHENLDVTESNQLRSGTEIFTAAFKLDSDFNYTSSENFYSKTVRTLLAQTRLEEERIQSSIKIYLHFLRLLI